MAAPSLLQEVDGLDRARAWLEAAVPGPRARLDKACAALEDDGFEVWPTLLWLAWETEGAPGPLLSLVARLGPGGTEGLAGLVEEALALFGDDASQVVAFRDAVQGVSAPAKMVRLAAAVASSNDVPAAVQVRGPGCPLVWVEAFRHHGKAKLHLSTGGGPPAHDIVVSVFDREKDTCLDVQLTRAGGGKARVELDDFPSTMEFWARIVPLPGA
jgi:hypothetical protein